MDLHIDWKTIVLQTLLTFVAVLVGIKFFAQDPSNGVKAHQEAYTIHMRYLDSRLSEIEDKLAAQNIPSAEQSEGTVNLKRINQTLAIVKERLAHLEKNLGNLSNTDHSLEQGSLPSHSRIQDPPLPAMDPTAWIEELSEQKRNEVNEVFRKHAQTIRDSFSVGSESARPNPEQVMKVMDEADKQLHENMRSVLSEKEYQKFLNSLPKRLPMKPMETTSASP